MYTYFFNETSSKSTYDRLSVLNSCIGLVIIQ